MNYLTTSRNKQVYFMGTEVEMEEWDEIKRITEKGANAVGGKEYIGESDSRFSVASDYSVDYGSTVLSSRVPTKAPERMVSVPGNRLVEEYSPAEMRDSSFLERIIA